MRAHRRFCHKVLGLLIAAVFAAAGWCQVSPSAGAIRGSVRDKSGASVPNASVTLENASLSLVRRATTAADGSYVFPLLRPSSGYQVRISAPGLESAVLTGLTVTVTETTNADATLAVGKIEQQVEVKADVQAVDTTSATLGSVVEGRVITSLPLPTRVVFDLMSTDAGVAATLTSPSATIVSSSNAIYVGGSRATANNYLLNGADANSPEFHTLAGGTVPIPSADSIQEFKTQTSQYDATTGYGGGGTLNLVTRAGTAQYHGTAYEFFRNNDFNANDFFQNRQGQKRPVLQQNQFGISAGGPLPKLGPTYFFVNYEGMRQRNGVSGAVSGSQPVLPATRDAASLAAAFGLPASAIDPVAIRILAAKGPYGGYLFPSGTGAAVGTLGTYAYSSPVISTSDQGSIRVDREFAFGSQSNHLFGTGFFNRGSYINPTGSSGSLGQGFEYPIANQHATLHDTHVFGPRLINDLVFGYNRIRRDIDSWGGGVRVQDVGMTRPNQSVFDLLPALTFANALSLSGTTVGRYQRTGNFDFRDTISWITGKHTLRLGFEVRTTQYNEIGVPATPLGTLAFTTGIANSLYGASPLGSKGDLAFRDFLIGSPSSISEVSGTPSYHIRSRDYIGFVQDDFRVGSRLTLNLGLRYAYLGNPWEIDNRFSNFDPSLLSSADKLNGGEALKKAFVIAGENGVSRSTYLAANNGNVSPRVGFAYDAARNGRLVVRGGWGLYYHATSDQQTYMIMNLPFYISATSTNQTRSQILATPFPSLPAPESFPAWTQLPAVTGLDSGDNPVVNGTQLAAFSVNRNAKAPYTANYSFSVAWRFAPGWTVDTGYRGSRGHRLTSISFPNNALLVNADSPARFGLTTNSSANRDARVPINGLGVNGLRYFDHNAPSAYDALLLTVSHPFARHFLFKGAYTYSKTIDYYTPNIDANYGTGVGNQYILSENKGLSSQHIPHRLVLTYVWDLPTPRPRLLKSVLGGWSLAGISTFQSGLAGTITQNSGNSTLSGSTGYGLVSTGCNLVASGRVEDHLNDFLNSACATTQPLYTGGAVLTGLTQYETPGKNSYTITPGKSGRLLGATGRGTFLAPFQQRWDTALSKNVPLALFGTEGNLKLRAEAFKVFNTPIFSAPASAAGAATFGRITSTVDNTGRQLQFAAKLSW